MAFDTRTIDAVMKMLDERVKTNQWSLVTPTEDTDKLKAEAMMEICWILKSDVENLQKESKSNDSSHYDSTTLDAITELISKKCRNQDWAVVRLGNESKKEKSDAMTEAAEDIVAELRSWKS